MTKERFNPDSELQVGQLFTSDVAADYPGPCPIDHFSYRNQFKGDVWDISLDCVGDKFLVVTPFDIHEYNNLSDALRKMAELIEKK